MVPVIVEGINCSTEIVVVLEAEHAAEPTE